jgi:hypothetical protein
LRATPCCASDITRFLLLLLRASLQFVYTTFLAYARNILVAIPQRHKAAHLIALRAAAQIESLCAAGLRECDAQAAALAAAPAPSSGRLQLAAAAFCCPALGYAAREGVSAFMSSDDRSPSGGGFVRRSAWLDILALAAFMLAALWLLNTFLTRSSRSRSTARAAAGAPSEAGARGLMRKTVVGHAKPAAATAPMAAIMQRASLGGGAASAGGESDSGVALGY